MTQVIDTFVYVEILGCCNNSSLHYNTLPLFDSDCLSFGNRLFWFEFSESLLQF